MAEPVAPPQRQPVAHGFEQRLEQLLSAPAVALTSEQEAYVRTSWLEELLAARGRRTRNRRWFRLLRFLAVAGALVLPVLTAVNLGGSADNRVRYTTFAVSILVALSSSGLQVF